MVSREEACSASRPPGFEFLITCPEGSVISPSSGGSPSYVHKRQIDFIYDYLFQFFQILHALLVKWPRIFEYDRVASSSRMHPFILCIFGTVFQILPLVQVDNGCKYVTNISAPILQTRLSNLRNRINICYKFGKNEYKIVEWIALKKKNCRSRKKSYRSQKGQMLH